MGSNPFRPPVSEERKAALRANGAKRLAALAKAHREPDSDAAGAPALPEARSGQRFQNSLCMAVSGQDLQA